MSVELAAEGGPRAQAAGATPPAERWFASHELRTSLQAIRGGLELLLAGSARGLSTAQLEALSLIAGAATDLERHGDELAELWQLIEQAPPQPARVELQGLLSSPILVRRVMARPDLVAVWDKLDVLLQADLAARAIERLARLGCATEPTALDLKDVSKDHVALRMAVSPPAAGDRAIAWRLALELCRHAGIGCSPEQGCGCTLTFRLVAAAAARSNGGSPSPHDA